MFFRKFLKANISLVTMNEKDDISNLISNENLNLKTPNYLNNKKEKLHFYQVLICLIINCFGPVTFYLPCKFEKVSLGIGLFIILVTAASAKLTLELLLILSREYKINKNSELVKLIMGNKMSIFVDGTIIINGFFTYILSFIQSELIK